MPELKRDVQEDQYTAEHDSASRRNLASMMLVSISSNCHEIFLIFGP